MYCLIIIFLFIILHWVGTEGLLRLEIVLIAIDPASETSLVFKKVNSFSLLGLFVKPKYMWNTFKYK